MAVALSYTLFSGQSLLATGSLNEVLRAAKQRFDLDSGASLLFFDDQSGQQVDFDLRGSVDDVLERVARRSEPVRPGRPKLGVVSREISLLPRHWEWLEAQPRGSSATLRRLVDQARMTDPAGQTVRAAKDAAGRFLSAMAGDLPGYEEAMRALYADSRREFLDRIQDWPVDIRRHAERIVQEAFLPSA